tara:strand:+ start:9059 stop:9910 length:852 start_codon:yes stop_codon:yes gene_type:complete
MSFSSIANAYLYSITSHSDNDIATKHTYLSISIGFLGVFTFFGIINCLAHLLGILLNYNLLIFIFSILLIILNKKNIQDLMLNMNIRLNRIVNISKEDLKLDAIKLMLLIAIALQSFCLIIRVLLPVTHGDQLGAYFYDSIQIANFGSLSTIDFYKLGQGLRTDSFASFFDAFTLQLTNSWTITRITRLIALILIVLTSIESAQQIFSVDLKKLLIIIALIISLPDIWDIGLSGKQDIYICAFEVTGISLTIIAFKLKNILNKIFLLSICLIIGIISIFSRLS